MTKECTCGDTGYHWLADENQAEANCWECYYKAEAIHFHEAFEEIGADVKPCDEELPW